MIEDPQSTTSKFQSIFLFSPQTQCVELCHHILIMKLFGSRLRVHAISTFASTQKSKILLHSTILCFRHSRRCAHGPSYSYFSDALLPHKFDKFSTTITVIVIKAPFICRLGLCPQDFPYPMAWRQGIQIQRAKLDSNNMWNGACTYQYFLKVT